MTDSDLQRELLHLLWEAHFWSLDFQAALEVALREDAFVQRVKAAHAPHR